MLGAVLVLGGCIVALVLFLFVSRLRRGHRRFRPAGGAKLPASGAAPGTSHYGLAPAEAARFQLSAREQMQREQEQWARDYLPGMPDDAMPGRVADIPRTLRVRR